MKALTIIVFLLSLSWLEAQIPTFSRTYPDTGNFSGTTKKIVEQDSGIFSFASAGSSLFVNQGGFQRTSAINEFGEIISDNFFYNVSRRYSSFCSTIKTSDGELVVFNTRSRNGGIGGNQIFVMKIKPNLQDTTWIYYHHDSLYFDTPADIIETSEENFALISTRAYFGQDDFDAIFLELNSNGQLLYETIIDEGIANTAHSMVETSSGNIIINGNTAETLGGNGLKVYSATLNSDRVVESTFLLPQLSEGGMSRFGPDKLVFSGSIIQTRNALLATHNTKRNQFDYLLGVQQGRFQTIRDSMLAINNRISPNADYEMFEKEINKIEIERRRNDALFYSANQKPIIETIALMCPLAGGPAVFKARAMLLAYNDSIVFLDDSLCVAQGYAYRLAAIEETTYSEPSEEPVVVYPNPSQGIIHIFTGTATFDEVKHIRVFSAQGQMVLQTAAAGSQFELDLSSRECSAGLYTIEVHFSTSGRSEHQKLLYAH